MKDLKELIYDLNGLIIRAKKFSEIGDKIVKILSPILPIEWTSICTIKGDKIVISALSSKVPSYFKEGEEIPLPGTATEYIFNTGEILYEEDLSKGYKFYTGKYHYERGIRSILRIPLIFEGKVFAVWVLASSKPYAYTQENIELLRIIASQISPPLRFFLIYEETTVQIELLQTINRLSKIVLSDIDVNRVFKEFAEELKKYIPFERLSIGILEGENIRYAAVSEVIKTGRFEGTKFPLKYTSSDWVIKNNQTLIRKDLLKEKTFVLEEIKVKQGFRSTMHVPLVYKGKVFGTLNFSSTKIGAYGEREKFIAEILVSQISSVIAISYLYSPLHNHLTEVYNRRYFDERFDEEIKYRERYGGNFCISLIDIDNFKRYNDFYGHLEGDKCLKEITKTMKEVIRKTDLIFRYGGDEFVILMPNTSLEEAKKVMERLKEIIREKFKTQGITLSIGLASYPQDGKTRTEIIDKADKRLIKAKESKDSIIYEDA